MRSVWLVLTIACLAQGCATNPVDQFYAPAIGMDPSDFETPSPSPVVVASSNYLEDGEAYLENGYGLVGHSDFLADYQPSKRQFESKAKEVGADIVLYTSGYSHTESGITTALGYTPGTTTTTSSTAYANSSVYGTVSGSAYGTGGYAYGSGSYSGYGTANAYATETTTTDPQFYSYQVPYTKNYYSFRADFLRKTKPPQFGAYFFGRIPEEVLQANNSNLGVCVAVVVKDSPAFRANLQRGDVITKVGDYSISSESDFKNAVRQYASQRVNLEIVRFGEKMNLEIVIGAPKESTPVEPK